MGRNLGVSNSTADIDSGNVLGLASLSTAAVSTVGFYGATPGSQRAAAVQAASVVSATSYISVTSNLAAFAAEVAATLTALGLWKGSA